MNTMEWKAFVQRLQSTPNAVHRFLPPCDPARIDQAVEDLGGLPGELRDMLHQFNGAHLFVGALPMVTIFGLSLASSTLSPMEWGINDYIDVMTTQWRRYDDRANDFAFGMSNYGSLMIIGADGIVREWDVATRDWTALAVDMNGWCEFILREGEEFLKG